ncbi:MAG: hypothetical protein PSV13_03015, partial [Lacunisphaera sp.]|nr:hypothetical protein [Lacunisphaera sp.]
MKPFLRHGLIALILTGRVLAAAPTPAEVEPPAKWRDLFRSNALSIVSENDKYFAQSRPTGSGHDGATACIRV